MEAKYKALRKRKFNKVMDTIGKGEGISSKEVQKEIQIVIDLGFDNPDAAIRAEWAKVLFKGERPTPQEVIVYLCKEMKKKQ